MQKSQPRDHMSLRLRLAIANEETNRLLSEALQFELCYELSEIFRLAV